MKTVEETGECELMSLLIVELAFTLNWFVCGPTKDHRFTTNSTDPVETGESDSELVLTRCRPVLIMSHGRLRISYFEII